MYKQARRGTDLGSGLDIGQGVKPVEKALNLLTQSAYKGRKRISTAKEIIFVLFAWGDDSDREIPVESALPILINIGFIRIEGAA